MNKNLIQQLISVVDEIISTTEGSCQENAGEIRDAFIEQGLQGELEEFLSWFDDQE